MSNITDATPHNETLPAMPDPPRIPHPQVNPCAGCPRFNRDAVIRYGSVILNRATRQVTWHGVAVPGITHCEFRVLVLVVASQGCAVRYRAIYDVVQRPGFVAGQTNGDRCEQGFHTNVRSCIKRIRKKFAAIDPSFRNIVNHSGVGYSWSMD